MRLLHLRLTVLAVVVGCVRAGTCSITDTCADDTILLQGINRVRAPQESLSTSNLLETEENLMHSQGEWILPTDWSIQASSQWNGDYGADNVKDRGGRPWHSRQTSPSPPQHLTFDAGAVVTLNAFATGHPTGWGGSAMRDYSFLRSNDGVTFEEVTAGTGMNLANGERQEIEFPAVASRYWRLQMATNYGYHHLLTAQYVEFRLVPPASTPVSCTWALPSDWSIQASSQWNGDYGPDNVKDRGGRPWHSRQTSPSPPQHLTFDAGAVVTLNAFATGHPTGWGGSAMRDYSFLRSNDGVTFEEVTAGTGMNLANGERQEIEFPAVASRYWRLQMATNYGYHHLLTAQYVEFRSCASTVDDREEEWEPESSSPCEEAMEGMGDWTVVRHAPPGNRWHGATDRLGGTAVYGDPAGGAHSDAEWSIAFNVEDVHTFLFATGDCEKWLIASKDAVIGEYYANMPRQIMESSTSEHPYMASWYNRDAIADGYPHDEDPWISLGDHGASVADGSILYGENHFGHRHAELVLPVHDGANVFVELWSSPCEAALQGAGGWTLVRHAPPGNQWHGATDRLGGTSVYGDPAGGPHSEAEWSAAFNVDDVSTFMFATGDCEKWLVASKDAVIGEYYANQPRQIMRSSTSEHPYTATWYNREAQVEDPWISLGDHHGSIQDGSILYGENHFGHSHAALVLPVHNGANVFVKL